MLYFQGYGSHKPGLGVQLNPEHPFAFNVRFLSLFNEPVRKAGDTYSSLAINNRLIYTQIGTPVKTSNRGGVAVSLTDADAYQIGINQAWMPTTAGTFAVIRRKRDTTNRASTLISEVFDSLSLYGPWSSGQIIWRVSGVDATTDVLTWSTSAPDAIVCTFGPSGSRVWVNGIKRASQSTPLVHVNDLSGHPLFVNAGARNGDLIDVNFVQVSAMQWSDNLCQWWSAEPYAHLYEETWTRTYFFFAQGSGTTISESVGTAAGTSTVLGVGQAIVDYTENSQSQPFGSINSDRQWQRFKT